jgi:NitT/TauT family transport system ATP-binding protein
LEIDDKMSAADEVISFEHVQLRFGGETIFSDVSFSIKRGEFVCLLGPSGCGKSTSLRLMGDLIQSDGGTIKVDGRDPSQSWDRLAFVFQSPRLLPWRTALENVMLGMELRGIDKAQWRERALAQLELVGLSRDGNKYPRMLSGGEKQRVSLARALAVNPDIVVMDEPFSALDPNTRERMRAEIITIWQKTQKTIVFVTHDVDEALLLADRILLFSNKPTRVLNALNVDEARPRHLRSNENLARQSSELMKLFGSLETGRI